MKQKIVIKMSMPCDKSRSKAMTLAARATGVTSMTITGDRKDRIELVGDGIDPVCLVSCLRRKLGHAEIIQVEEVKDKKEEEKKPEVKKPEEEKKNPEEPKKPVVVHAQPQFYPSCYGHHPYPPPLQPRIVFSDEHSTCSVM